MRGCPSPMSSARLLDGLSMPRHSAVTSGEVLHAFQVGMDRLDIELIAGYASKLGAATVKRLGVGAWNTMAPASPSVDQLASLPVRGYRMLDPTGPRRGHVQQPLDGPGEHSRDG